MRCSLSLPPFRPIGQSTVTPLTSLTLTDATAPSSHGAAPGGRMLIQHQLTQLLETTLPFDGLHPGGSPPSRSPRALSRSQSAASLPFSMASRSYGNKTANLLELEKIARDIPGVQVPDFLAISHGRVGAHLAKYSKPLDVADMWSSFVRAQGDATRLQPSAGAILVHMRRHIERVFEEHALADAADWLDVRQGCRIMVRSTGREDSELVENAGGNESIANVEPSVRAVSAAIGRVISSYFSEKSLMQRLQAGDDIRQAPFFPVVLQVMEAEKPGEALPISGVMYTSEPVGPTPGTVVTTVAYGHNHGVVSSTVPADTVFMGVEETWRHDVTRDKPERVTPDPSGGLWRVPNSEDIRRSAALDERLQARLLLVRNRVVEHFGAPRDIEWTYNPATDVLSLLQARPLRERVSEPSYLRRSAIPELLQVAATPVVNGDCRVRVATEPSHLIITTSIQQALDAYCMVGDRKAVKAVLIAQSALSTSHESTSFRAVNIPVLQVHEDMSLMRQWIEVGVICIDTQLGAVVSLSRSSLGVAECTPDGVRARLRQVGALREGFARHPVASQLSISTSVTDEERVRVETFLRAFVGALFMRQDVDSAPLDELLRILAESDPIPGWEDVVRDAPGRNRLEQIIYKLQHPGSPTVRMQALANLLRTALHITATAARNPALRLDASRIIWQMLSDSRLWWTLQNDGSTDMEVRLAVNWLRAAATQQFVRGIVGQHSLELLLTDMAERQRIGVEHHSAAQQDRKIVYARTANLALGTDVRTAWRAFTDRLQRRASDDMHGILLTMIGRMEGANILGWWLNTSFHQAWAAANGQLNGVGATQCLQALVKEFTAPATQEALSWNAGMRSSIESWKGRASEWSEVRNFDAMWKQFSRDLANDELTARMHALYERSNPLGVFIALGVVDAWVDVYDTSIKSLIGTPNYANLPRLRAQRFLTMLGPFTAGMQRWVDSADTEKNYVDGLRRIDHLKARLKGALLGPTGDDHEAVDKLMYPSPNFSVDLATFSEGTTDAHCHPKTINDLFTLAHQNMVAALATLKKRQQPGLTDMLPAIVRQVADTFTVINSRHGLTRRAHLQSVHIDYPHVTYEYVMALRQHSARFRLKYDNSKADVPRVQLGIELCGETERRHRMERIMFYLALVSHKQDIAFVRGMVPLFHRNVLSFTWDLNLKAPQVQSFLRDLRRHVENIGEMTFVFDRGYRPDAGYDLDDIIEYARPACNVTKQDLADLPRTTLAAYPWFNDQIIAAVPTLLGQLNVCSATLAAGADTEAVNPGLTNRVVAFMAERLEIDPAASVEAWAALHEEQQALLERVLMAPEG